MDDFGANVGGSPPLTRGLLRNEQLARFCCRITPAYAGTTEIPHTESQVIKDHPRLRGDYSLINFLDGLAVGSPPLTRGLQLAPGTLREEHGITPAYAGTTYSQRSDFRCVKDHPRLRGDYNLNC